MHRCTGARLPGPSWLTRDFLGASQAGSSGHELRFQEWTGRVCPARQRGPSTQRRARHGVRHGKGCRKAGRARRPAYRLSGAPDERVAGADAETLLPPSPEGEACFKNKNAGSPPSWLGAAHPQLPPPPAPPVKVLEVCAPLQPSRERRTDFEGEGSSPALL